MLLEPSGIDHTVAITRSITIFTTAFLVVIAATATAAAFLVLLRLVLMVLVPWLVAAPAAVFSDVVTARTVRVVMVLVPWLVAAPAAVFSDVVIAATATAAAFLVLLRLVLMVLVPCLVVATAAAFSDVVIARTVRVVMVLVPCLVVATAAAFSDVVIARTVRVVVLLLRLFVIAAASVRVVVVAAATVAAFCVCRFGTESTGFYVAGYGWIPGTGTTARAALTILGDAGVRIAGGSGIWGQLDHDEPYPSGVGQHVPIPLGARPQRSGTASRNYF